METKTRMWDVNLQANGREAHTDAHRPRRQCGGCQGEPGDRGRQIRAKASNTHAAMEGDLALGGEQTMRYTDDLLQSCALGAGIISLATVTSMDF